MAISGPLVQQWAANRLLLVHPQPIPEGKDFTGLFDELLVQAVRTDLPVKEIAEQLGYSDVYFFTRQFHRYIGLPPAKFRKIRQR